MANANRQFNRIAEAHGLDVVDTVRLAAMINVIAADAAIAFFSAEYHYLFWRRVNCRHAASTWGPLAY